MINQFLAYLDNRAEPPGQVYWPSFTPKSVSQLEADARVALLGDQLPRRQHFYRAVQLLWAVEESSLIGKITEQDSRLTYDRAQLAGLIRRYGTTVLSTGVPTTAIVQLQLYGQQEYGFWTLSTTDGYTFVASSDSGVVSTTVTYDAGLSTAIALPGGIAAVRVQQGPPAAGASWEIEYWTQPDAWISRISTVDLDKFRGLLSNELLEHYDASPLWQEKLAAIVVGMAQP
jgi:hypothetical protein